MSQTAPEKVEQYLSFFKQCQELAQERLGELGYEKICPTQGELVVPGEVISSGRVELTSQQELHGRVFSALPGKAGYRKDGKVLAPAEVVVYRYQPVS